VSPGAGVYADERLRGDLQEEKALQCKPDDMMDAVCLAVTGALYAHGLCETIPANPDRDAHGLEMKMTVPKKQPR